jgi:dUTP pyrophosphatase
MTASNAPAVTSIQQPLPPLLIKKLVDSATAPTRGSAFAAGYDMYAAKETVVPAKGKALIDTGIAMAVPEGTCMFDVAFTVFGIWKWRKKVEADSFLFLADGRVAPRSGLASKHFIDTGAGVIDADYRGEVKVLLFNHSDVDFPGTWFDVD